VSKDTLYRIERGKQEPTLEFGLATNLILCGGILSDDLIFPCVSEGWRNPVSDPATALLIRRGIKDGGSSFRENIERQLQQTDYSALLQDASWADYQVYISRKTNDGEL